MPHLTRDELSWRRARRRQTDRHESSHVLRTVVAPAVLAVAVIVAIVFAVTGGDGSGSASVGPVASPVPPSGITAAAAPQRVVMARSGRLEVVLPVAEKQVTAVYFRTAGDPGGIAMTPASGLPRAVTQDESTTGAPLSAVDVGAPAGSVVYSPVDGVVTAVSPYRVLGSPEGLSIVLTPSGMPDVAVNVTHVEPGPDGAVPRVGSAVGAGRTVLGRVRDLSRVETPAITRYTNDAGNHVTVELLRQATGPGA